MRKLVLLCLGCLLWFCGCTSGEQENREELLRSATAINEKCPKMLDSETRLDGLGVKEPNTLVYNYTLVNLVADHVDTVQFYRALWPGVISHIRVSPELKKIREANTSIEYAYRDKNNRLFYTLRISPSDYK